MRSLFISVAVLSCALCFAACGQAQIEQSAPLVVRERPVSAIVGVNRDSFAENFRLDFVVELKAPDSNRKISHTGQLEINKSEVLSINGYVFGVLKPSISEGKVIIFYQLSCIGSGEIKFDLDENDGVFEVGTGVVRHELPEEHRVELLVPDGYNGQLIESDPETTFSYTEFTKSEGVYLESLLKRMHDLGLDVSVKTLEPLVLEVAWYGYGPAVTL